MKCPCRTVIFCGTAFLLLLGAAFILPPGAVWITDNGNKYMMMRNFSRGSGHIISHSEPSLFPTGGFHFIKTPEGVRSFYPEYLSFLSVPFYKLFGERGVLVLPCLASLLLLFMAWKYWNIPPPVLLLGTPLFFYSLLLWEMTPSVCFVLAVLLLCGRNNFFCAGSLLGISLLMREEAYFVCAAMGGALLLTGRWKEMFRFGAGFLWPALLIWGFQWRSTGHILGYHGKNYYLNNNSTFSLFSQFKVVFFNFHHHLFRFDAWGNSPVNHLLWSVLLPLAAGALPRFKSGLAFKYAACGIYLSAITVLTWGAWFQKETIYTASAMTGALTATPLIAGFLLNWRPLLRLKRFRLGTLFALLYLLGVPPLMTASDIGLVWGARHFLVLLPLLLFLSFCGFRLMGIPPLRRKVFSWKQLLPLGALAAGIFIQLFGLFALYHISGDSYRIEQRLLALREKVIVTDVFYIPEQMPRLFFEKDVLQVCTADDLSRLRRYLHQKGETGFLLLLSPRFRRMNDDVLKALLQLFPLTSVPERLQGTCAFPDLFAGRCIKYGKK